MEEFKTADINDRSASNLIDKLFVLVSFLFHERKTILGTTLGLLYTWTGTILRKEELYAGVKKQQQKQTNYMKIKGTLEK